MDLNQEPWLCQKDDGENERRAVASHSGIQIMHPKIEHILLLSLLMFLNRI